MEKKIKKGLLTWNVTHKKIIYHEKCLECKNKIK